MGHNRCAILYTACYILHVFDAHSRALVYNHNAVTVGHLQDLLSIRVVTSAERVCAHPLHQVEIFHNERPVKALTSNLQHKRKRIYSILSGLQLIVFGVVTMIYCKLATGL